MPLDLYNDVKGLLEKRLTQAKKCWSQAVWLEAFLEASRQVRADANLFKIGVHVSRSPGGLGMQLRIWGNVDYDGMKTILGKIVSISGITLYFVLCCVG